WVAASPGPPSNGTIGSGGEWPFVAGITAKCISSLRDPARSGFSRTWMAPHRALLLNPGKEHDWSATGRAYPTCAAATITTNANSAERRNRKRFITGADAIDSLRGRVREAIWESQTRPAELTVQR